MSAKKKEQKFRCVACMEHKDTSALMCGNCINDMVDNRISQAIEPLKTEIKELKEKLASAKIVFGETK